MFRQLTCPLYGVTEGIIRGTCNDLAKFERALSNVVATGAFQFAKLGSEDVETMRPRVRVEVGAIRNGKGDDLLSDFMGWVRSVQLRALQDHAADSPEQFERAWCTVYYCRWSEQGKQRAVALRTREERDLGLVPASVTPMWSPTVGTLRDTIRKAVRDIAIAIDEEDKERWHCCGGTTLLAVGAVSCDSDIVCGSVADVPVQRLAIGGAPTDARTTEVCHTHTSSDKVPRADRVPLSGKDAPFLELLPPPSVTPHPAVVLALARASAVGDNRHESCDGARLANVDPYDICTPPKCTTSQVAETIHSVDLPAYAAEEHHPPNIRETG